ncbi:DUF2497 domain-containing protein [Sphingomicrobium clamense]|uniref:DUF2497 domain-containing protein n=1 Tax=Sphingomicrobium clamense TaxID=2851013 RepID=A0ABS6V8R4_9SPHN|nr:DUF2497 domain-containing protein [Sphingomicrobium sp. B8]MBW0145552.1 DUF2497 domain-containing protein [Sphingomicrobium sp. B8]
MAAAQEPSMEDILASIKKVIAEEKEFRDSDSPDNESHDENEILELDESMAEVPADGTGHQPSAQPAAVASLMAEEVAENTRASLEQLGEVTKSDPTAAAANPFEDMVRDMLRPMLKQWLDERLPGIVDEHVRAEISRITGRKL